MSNLEDKKALQVLEKAVLKAQTSLENTKHFQPFAMLVNDAGNIEIFENKIKDSMQSYAALEDVLKIRMEKKDVDVLVLLVDTLIPDKFGKDVPNGIRIHLEERSQVKNKIGARYLYVPYELCKYEEELFVKLYTPIPVGLSAEYIFD